jgi:hypothetical protein
MLGELKPKGPKGPSGTENIFEKGEVFAYVGLPQNLKDLKEKGRRALLRIPSTEGRSVCLCWEHSKPKGPKGSNPLHYSQSLLYEEPSISPLF